MISDDESEPHVETLIYHSCNPDLSPSDSFTFFVGIRLMSRSIYANQSD
jgi:hypothetical protein